MIAVGQCLCPHFHFVRTSGGKKHGAGECVCDGCSSDKWRVDRFSHRFPTVDLAIHRVRGTIESYVSDRGSDQLLRVATRNRAYNACHLQIRNFLFIYPYIVKI